MLPPGFEPGLEGVLGGSSSRLEGPLSLTGLDYGSTIFPERPSLFKFGPGGPSADAFPSLELLHLAQGASALDLLPHPVLVLEDIERPVRDLLGPFARYDNEP
jgi:hypothetical protein